MINSTRSFETPKRVGFQHYLSFGDEVSNRNSAQGIHTELHGDGEFEPCVLELFQRLDDTVEPLTGLADPRVKRLAEGLIQGADGLLPAGFRVLGDDATDSQGRAELGALLTPSFGVSQSLIATVTQPGVVSVQLTTHAGEQQPTVPGLYRASQLLQGEFRDGALEPGSVRESVDMGYLIAPGG